MLLKSLSVTEDVRGASSVIELILPLGLAPWMRYALITRETTPPAPQYTTVSTLRCATSRRPDLSRLRSCHVPTWSRSQACRTAASDLGIHSSAYKKGRREGAAPCPIVSRLSRFPCACKHA